MELKEYAWKILKDAGCDEYTYGGKWSDTVLDDLKRAFKPGELEYPYVEVANAILEISRPEPIWRPPYKAVLDTEHDVNSLHGDSFEDAKATALNIYKKLMRTARMHWKSEKPMAENIKDWNHMIDNCCCYIVKYNPETDEYTDADDAYYLPDEELEAIGWKEIPYTIDRETYIAWKDQPILHDEDEWYGAYKTYGEMWTGEGYSIEDKPTTEESEG